MTSRQERILNLIWGIVFSTVSDEADWMWCGNDLGYCGPELPFGIAAEVDNYATASCGPQLWAVRAMATKALIPIPTVDWWFYNVRGREIVDIIKVRRELS